MPRLLRLEHYDQAEESSSDEIFDLDSADFESRGLTTSSYVHQRHSSSSWSSIKYLPRLIGHALRRQGFQTPGRKRHRHRTSSHRKPFTRRLLFGFQCLTGTFFALILITALFWPSYTRPPAHYNVLRKRVLASDLSGRGNIRNEKIFIAASIYDKGGHLADGAWGSALLDLIDILGNRNVFLSIYENDAGEQAEEALIRFKDQVPCQNDLVFERHLSLKTVPSVILPDGSKRTKRIAYLAAVRNRALQPLDEASTPKYDKLLFLNDIAFDPIDAVQLLFSTNVNEAGKSSYLASCAVDFINPFKFYDTFATRDAEGYSMGVPFFPWFSDASRSVSRQDVIHGKDAVQVKSCWGGMVAFDASYFQIQSSEAKDASTTTNTTASVLEASGLPIRFRAEADLYWEASECCLVHADLQRASNRTLPSEDVGIYMNPYVRVAYSSWTLWWLPITRRIEKLYTIPHNLINHLVGMPRYNSRRNEIGGKEFKERVWKPDAESVAGGSFQEINRVAENGGYCGFRTLQLIKETVRKGEKNWETVAVPSGE
ncbi:MAG: hypothetical protein LQ352_001236 [Teloschistes flavicans]|nr:MAG: hypothetical protein LQ352_001236 [Teloschistes flavicans]